MVPTLSICIPTYNRSGLLAELLDSIIAQEMPEIEVIVSDDASPDDTASVLAGYSAKIPRLTVIHHPTNIGVDRNFLAVIAAATGDYVWLMGDDDRLEPGGARRVIAALERWPEVSGLTLGVIDYDSTMTRPTGLRRMPPTQKMDTVSQVFGTMSDLLGFMSALVIRRTAWMEIVAENTHRAFENYYVQVYIVGRMIARHGGWGVVQEPCVGFRTSNDQFLAKLGWIERLKVDVVAYEQIEEALLANDRAARAAMRQQIFDTHVMARITNAKTTSDRTPQIGQAITFLFDHYKDLPSFWTKALPTLLAPNWLMRSARTTYKRFGKSSGAARARQLSDQLSET